MTLIERYTYIMHKYTYNTGSTIENTLALMVKAAQKKCPRYI